MAILALPVDQRIIDIDSRRFASIEKALVELVTNCDDSYSKLEQAGVKVSGSVVISYERHDTGAILTVTDQAEGMTLDRLRTILSYGGAHSRLSSGGSSGRGYFGRGLKQAVFGLGHGWIETVRDGRLSRVDLFRNELGSYVYDDQDGDRPAADRDYARLGLEVEGNGTRVTIVADNPQVSLPYFRSLVRAVSNNFYLRDITQRRQLQLLNGNLPKKHATATPLHFEEPPSELLLGPELASFVFLNQGYDFTVTVRKAAAELVLRGDERTSGLLVMSGTAVLDCQFFRYEGQIGTEYLFGTVTCPGLIAMLAAGRPVISDEREGLNLKEPFVAAFADAVSATISPIIESERLRLSHLDHAATSKRTESLLQLVLARMNQAAVDDLGITLPPGPGTGSYGPFPTGRPAVLRFSTPFYYRPIGRAFHVSLLVDRARLLDEQVLQVARDLPDSILIDPDIPQLTVGDLPADGRFTWSLTGYTAGDKGRIRVTGGPYSAACEVVIAEGASRHTAHTNRPARPSTPWDQDNSTDLFVGYELRNLDNDIDRAVYSPLERLIIVNTEAPTVRLYIDGQGRFRDSARLLLAELFLDVIAGELARRYIDRTLQKGDSEAYEQAKQTFIRRYGLEIHRILNGT